MTMKSVARLHRAARRFAHLQGERHGMASYSGSVRGLGAFVVGKPNEDEWLDANAVAEHILELADEPPPQAWDEEHRRDLALDGALA